jgi:hypothetical protein
MDKKENSLANSTINSWVFVSIACVTLGLAPFTDPHIVGKLEWIAGGANGMKLIDWGDLLFHGFPWVLLGRLTFLQLKQKFNPVGK